jgi:hypothetical protein
MGGEAGNAESARADGAGTGAGSSAGVAREGWSRGFGSLPANVG